MMAHSSKLKGYLEAIKPSSDALVRYSALQELNELLVASNKDTLSGYYPSRHLHKGAYWSTRREANRRRWR